MLINKPAADHIGVVVKDIKKTTEDLSSLLAPLGLTRWWIGEYSPSKDETALVPGGKAVRVNTAHAMLGGIEFHLMEPLDEHSMFAEFLRTKGEGVQHVAWAIPNWEETVERLQGQAGGKMVVSASVRGKRYAYFEVASGGMFLEFIEP